MSGFDDRLEQGLLRIADRATPSPDAWEEIQARIASIETCGTIAVARLEIDNWTGHRFTDLFTLLKVDGEWKVMNKVFHLHA